MMARNGCPGQGGGAELVDVTASTDDTANQCLALSVKIFQFTFDPNHLHIHRRPGPHRGAFRDRHGRRAGDAVDADGAAQTFCVDEALISRTAKSCGPDAPTLASSSREASFLGATVTTKPGHRGEREISC
jgi:hypothetical protein